MTGLNIILCIFFINSKFRVTNSKFRLTYLEHVQHSCVKEVLNGVYTPVSLSRFFILIMFCNINYSLFTKTLIHIVLIKVDKSGTCCYIHVGNNIKASDFTRNIVSPTNVTKAPAPLFWPLCDTFLRCPTREV
jgi:hypothetical protein